MVQMRGHGIHFHWEIRKIISELSLIPLLSGARGLTLYINHFKLQSLVNCVVGLVLLKAGHRLNFQIEWLILMTILTDDFSSFCMETYFVALFYGDHKIKFWKRNHSRINIKTFFFFCLRYVKELNYYDNAQNEALKSKKSRATIQQKQQFSRWQQCSNGCLCFCRRSKIVIEDVDSNDLPA